jgi:hypothetical protein
LLGYDACDLGITMTDEVDDGTGGEVEIAMALRIEEPRTVAADRYGIGLVQDTVKDSGTLGHSRLCGTGRGCFNFGVVGRYAAGGS